MASILKKVLHSTGNRTPQDLVSRLCAALEKITESSTDKQQEDAAKLLYQMKVCCHLKCNLLPFARPLLTELNLRLEGRGVCDSHHNSSKQRSTCPVWQIAQPV